MKIKLDNYIIKQLCNAVVAIIVVICLYSTLKSKDWGKAIVEAIFLSMVYTNISTEKKE